MQIDQPALSQAVLLVPAVMLAAEMSSNGRRRAAPEGKPPARDPLVQYVCNIEAVIDVALVVLKKAGDFVPESAPRRP